MSMPASDNHIRHLAVWAVGQSSAPELPKSPARRDWRDWLDSLLDWHSADCQVTSRRLSGWTCLPACYPKDDPFHLRSPCLAPDLSAAHYHSPIVAGHVRRYSSGPRRAPAANHSALLTCLGSCVSPQRGHAAYAFLAPTPLQLFHQESAFSTRAHPGPPCTLIAGAARTLGAGTARVVKTGRLLPSRRLPFSATGIAIRPTTFYNNMPLTHTARGTRSANTAATDLCRAW